MNAIVATTRVYEKRIAKLLTVDVRIQMEAAIAASPLAHPVIPGTNGVRKARWSRAGMGKRGGIRVAYYYAVAPNLVLMITAYAKNERENLTHADKTEIRRIVESFRHTQ